MKKLILILLCFFVCLSSFAAKKKKRNYLSYTGGTYVHAYDSIQHVGDVFDFSVKALADQIVIDSVWFGNTPLPCNVFDLQTKQKADLIKKNGRYSVRVNKDLYKNYPNLYDSTVAYQNFKPPFRFYGDAVIMYLYKGKRFYKSVHGVKRVQKKGTRT